MTKYGSISEPGDKMATNGNDKWSVVVVVAVVVKLKEHLPRFEGRGSKIMMIEFMGMVPYAGLSRYQ